MIGLLESFFLQYEGNLTRYAIEKEAWKVAYKDDEESLKHYTLHAELSHHFGTESRGEFIGTSGPEAFYPYTTMVQQQSAFSFCKMLSGAFGKEITITRLTEDGSQAPMTLADHIEDEMNEDIRSADLVLRFDTTLGMCAELGRRFPKLATDAVASYQFLFDCLRDVRDGKIANQPPF
jgi:hypothetical protein